MEPVVVMLLQLLVALIDELSVAVEMQLVILIDHVLVPK